MANLLLSRECHEPKKQVNSVANVPRPDFDYFASDRLDVPLQLVCPADAAWSQCTRRSSIVFTGGQFSVARSLIGQYEGGGWD
jgi:hypothetical protein